MDAEKTVTQVGPDVRVECNKNKTVTISVGATKITVTDGAINISGDPAVIVNSQDVTFTGFITYLQDVTTWSNSGCSHLRIPRRVMGSSPLSATLGWRLKSRLMEKPSSI
jgi:hypothetical protein